MKTLISISIAILIIMFVGCDSEQTINQRNKMLKMQVGKPIDRTMKMEMQEANLKFTKYKIFDNKQTGSMCYFVTVKQDTIVSILLYY